MSASFPLFNRKIAELSDTVALPSAAGTVRSDAIDLRGSDNQAGGFSVPIELRVTAPVMDVNQLPNDNTVIYSIEHGNDPNALTWLATIGTQTGAAGAGAAAAEFRFRPPSTIGRYVKVKAVTNAAVDVSALSYVVDVLV